MIAAFSPLTMHPIRLAFILAVLAAAAASEAVVVTYTSLAAWQAAVGSAPTTLETFSTDRNSDPNSTISFSGFDAVAHENDGNVGVLFANRGQLSAAADGDRGADLTLVPDAPSSGFAADFFDANTSEGLRIVLSTGEAFDVGVNTGFFGFTSTVAFTSFRIVSRGGNGDFARQEGYAMDNARFANVSTSAVPGPAAALPFAALVLRRRKRA